MPAKKDGWGQWNGDLPEGPALDDLDELAKEFGLTRAETNRVILVAWSRALRGIPLMPVAMAGGFPITPAGGGMPGAQVTAQQAIESTEPPDEMSPLEAVRARAAMTVSGIDLDDD